MRVDSQTPCMSLIKVIINGKMDAANYSAYSGGPVPRKSLLDK